MNEYVITKGCLSKITTHTMRRMGRKPACRLCGKLLELGNMITSTQTRSCKYAHKACYERSLY